jgi:predicted RNA binding protein YcfA (HicA-like mRNA interferase family)
MPRGLNNWKYTNVINFLKEHGFLFHEHKKGSHEAWIGNINGVNTIVEVNFIQGNKSYPPRTIETMIRQSTINKKEWKKWYSK